MTEELIMAKSINTLKLIAEDMKRDAKEFDGKPFNGKTVAAYFGYQGAAIAALAKTLKLVIESINLKEEK